MSIQHQSSLNPVAFLQTFIVQSIKIANQLGSQASNESSRYIEHMGLAAASCLESFGRGKQSLSDGESLDQARYARLIVDIKNQIGGKFSLASSEPGRVSVVNHSCPFGDAVLQAPELCRMTSSVFGAIAARNFGYAKVNLEKRIATGDGYCEAHIFIDPDVGRIQPGDEYKTNGSTVSSWLAGHDAPDLQRDLSDAWCNDKSSWSQMTSNVNVVAESVAMRSVLRTAKVAALSDASVLITGETGVGKEVISRAIHAFSDRHEKPFITVNCGAIPDGLVESELFGHERGAFTGACDIHHGYFERANGGTLFLDEIDALPLLMQVKLLRVLQKGTFQRVGGSQILTAHVRVLAATNQDIGELLRTGCFRQDLYFRLNVIPIEIPPLHSRLDDLSALVHYIMKRLAQKYSIPEKSLSPKAWQQLFTYDWPGNVRELENLLERAFLFSAGKMIDVIMGISADEKITSNDELPLRELKRQVASAAECNAIRNSLQRYHGRIHAVARELGISSRAVHQKLKSHGINPENYRHVLPG